MLRPLFALGLSGLFIAGCSTTPDVHHDHPAERVSSALESAPKMTSELRDGMTPDQVLAALVDGNKRFLAGTPRHRDLGMEVREGADGQTPYAAVLSCIDSRVPIETVFDQRIGDVFVTRLAGNVVNEDAMGGLEFATQLAGAKLVLVMGHTKCGAVKGAAAGAELGHLTGLVGRIQPSVESAAAKWGKAPDASDYGFVDLVAQEHVKQAVRQLREQSEHLRKLEEAGSIRIVGAMYDISTGRVTIVP